jgi:hypothetical protein|tara:strand:+ start:284 stop:733 length:450 start_codon:yes stop_codon:yes gene_type:complete
MTKKEDILDKAMETVGRRGRSYGTPFDNFTRIADLWSCHLAKDISCYDVGVLFILAKLARSKQDRGNEDNWVDIAGYASAVAEAIDRQHEIDANWEKKENEKEREKLAKLEKQIRHKVEHRHNRISELAERVTEKAKKQNSEKKKQKVP